MTLEEFKDKLLGFRCDGCGKRSRKWAIGEEHPFTHICPKCGYTHFNIEPIIHVPEGMGKLTDV